MADTGRVFYVTVRDAGRVGWLLGPYPDHAGALANVERARALAEERDGYAVFYAFGTASIPADAPRPVTVFGI